MRRRLVSNWKFQFSFALAMVRGVIFGLMLPGLVAILSLYLMSRHADILPAQKDILIEGINNLVLSFVGISAALALVNGLFGFFVSQRFAGPLTRIETWSVQHLMMQDPGPLKVRERDELSFVAVSLDRVVRKQQNEVEIS